MADQDNPEAVSPEAKADAALAQAQQGPGPSSKPPKPAEGAGLGSDIGPASSDPQQRRNLARPTLSLDDIDRISKQEGQDGTGGPTQTSQAVGGVRPDAVIGWTGARAFNTRYLDPPLGFEQNAPPDAQSQTPPQSSSQSQSQSQSQTQTRSQSQSSTSDLKSQSPSEPPAGAAPTHPKKDKRQSLHEFAEFLGAPRGRPETRSPSEVEADEIKQLTWETPLISAFVPDKFLGYWWFQAAAAIVSILLSWITVRLRLGLGGALSVGAAAAVYWNAGMRRARQRARDQITRELQAKKMEDQFETMEWANFFLARFWPIFEPIICGMVVSQAEEQIPQYLPKFIESVRLSTFTLGSKPPRVNHVRTFPDTPDDVVLMDWKFSFTPNDNIDLTTRQSADIINPRIRISVRLGKGAAVVALPIDVEDFTFTGYVRLRLKLVTNFPHIQIADVTLLDPPYYDYVLKPIGGHTLGWDVNNIPGLTNFIKDQVNTILSPMVYAPNVFSLNIEELLAGQPLDAATGVVQVNLTNASDIKATKFGGGKPDPYVALAIDDGETQSRTKTIPSTNNPVWKETQYALVRNLNGFLTLHLMDFNDHRPDNKLGMVSFPLDGLDSEPQREGISSQVQLGGRYRGTLNYSVNYFPVLTPQKNPDGSTEPIPESRSGIVRMSVYEAKGLPKRGLGEPSSAVRIMVDGKPVGESSTKKRTASPNWAYTKEFLSTNRDSSKVSIQIVASELGSTTVLGQVTKRLQDLVDLKAKGTEWFDVGGGAQVRLATFWKPVAMTGGANGGAGYTPPIGTLKILAKSASDVKNVEALSGGKSDPYAQLRFRGAIVDRTEVQEDNLDPVWNEYLYSPVHSLSDTVMLEMQDFQNNGKHRPLGSVSIPVADLAAENKQNNETPYKSLGRQQRTEMIAVGKQQYKGTVDYEVEFVPALNLAGVDFLAAHGEGEKEEEKAETKAQDPEKSESPSQAKKEVAEDKDKTVATAQESQQEEEKKKEEEQEKEPEPVERSLPQLLESPTGLLAFNVLSASVAKEKTSVEIWFDDCSWPTWQTEPSKSAGTIDLDDVGERLIRELVPSRVIIRLRKGSGEDLDDVYAQYEGQTRDLLSQSFEKPVTIPLAPTSTKGSAAAGGRNSLTLMCKYVPVNMVLDPAERFDNGGLLSVNLISGAHLRPADRGKSSDPFVRILVNGERLAKSKVVKKTLNPEFNELLKDIPVRSRATQPVVLKINDWDQMGGSDPLGEAQLDLSSLVSGQDFVEATLPLTGEGAGDKEPSVTLGLAWRAAWIEPAGRGGGAGQAAVAVPGQVGRAGIKAAGTVGKTAFSAPSKAFGFVRRGVHGHSHHPSAQSDATGAGAAEAGYDVEGGSSSPPSAWSGPTARNGEAGAGTEAAGGSAVGAEQGGLNPPPSPGDTGSLFGGKRRSKLHNPFKKG